MTDQVFSFDELTFDPDGRELTLVIEGRDRVLPFRPVWIPPDWHRWRWWTLDQGQGLTEVAYDIYKSVTPWSLLVAWNPELPGGVGYWIQNVLPAGTRIRYLDLDLYRAIQARSVIPLLGAEAFEEIIEED